MLMAIGLTTALAGSWLLMRAVASARRGQAWLWTALTVSLSVTMLAIAVAALALAAGLRVYEVFTRETLVARVWCERTDRPDRFHLWYEPIGTPTWWLTVDRWQDQQWRRYTLVGDQWAIEGEFVKWRSPLTLLGFQPLHKPTRLSGRYSDVRQQTAHQPTAHALNGGVDWLWRFLYIAARHWPGAEAIYGSGAYVAVEPGVEYGVYVTTSGYLIKRTVPVPNVPKPPGK